MTVNNGSDQNFPIPLTSFVGREEETNGVCQLLAKTRLLTLTGPGGVGKTRLALQCATIANRNYIDGACWVDFAPLADPLQLTKTVSKALGILEVPSQALIETIVASLRSRHFLLVFDNCEHLITPIAELVEKLLSICPELTILATSREEFGLFGEVTWRVPSLPFPALQLPLKPEKLQEYASVRLFIERVGAVSPGYQLTARNAHQIALICKKLDGLPLAIELAAARMKLLSAEEIAERLEDRFHLLTGGSRTALPRQQTILATIDWSYNLLSEPERMIFRYFSVFAGSFTLTAAEKIAPPTLTNGPSVLDLLAQLVSKSLIQIDRKTENAAGVTRYRMLETIREYARVMLERMNETRDAQNRFLDYILNLAKEAQPGLYNQEQKSWSDRLEEEHANLYAVMDWSLRSQNYVAAAQLALFFKHFWNLRGYYEEGSKWLSRILEVTDHSDKTGAELLLTRGDFERARGNFDQAVDFVQASLATFDHTGDIAGIARAKGILGTIYVFHGQRGEGLRLLEDCLQFSRDIGDDWEAARCLLYISDTYNRMGKHELAAKYSWECLERFRSLGDQWGIAFASGTAGEICRQQGNYQEAKRYYREALRIHWQQGQYGEIPYPLETLAIIEIMNNDCQRAIRLWGAAEAYREEHNIPLPPAYREDYQKYLSLAQDCLGESVYTRVEAEGRGLSIEQVISLALQDLQPASSVPGGSVDEPQTSQSKEKDVARFGLTKREAEVLQLVAIGYTDAQVAEKLYVSPRTVGKHLQSIYQKLQVKSRTAAARFAHNRHV